MIDLSNIGIDFLQNNFCYESEKNDTFNNENKKKISVNNIIIEITRKCNYRCKHCGRGKAQNLTISKEIIDRFFESVENIQGSILFTGGEPLLAIDMIDYFCEKLINSNFSPTDINIVTNGNVSEEANNVLINTFQKVINKKRIECNINISCDKFHTEQDRKNNYIKSYKLFKEYESSLFHVFLYGLHDTPNPNIHNSDRIVIIDSAGNAKELLHNDKYKDYLDKNDILIVKPSLYSGYCHRIPIINNTVSCRLSLLVNGNIELYQEWEYNKRDKHSLGNLFGLELKDIINNYNQKAVVDCYEERNYNQLNIALSNIEVINFSNKKDLKNEILIYKYCYQRLFEARKIFLELFPAVPVKAIRESFVIPSYENWLKMLYSIYKEIYKGKLTLGDIENNNYANSFLSILEDKKTNLGEKYNLISANKDYVKEYMIYHFGDLSI